MKKSVISKMLCLLLILSFVLGVSIGCNNKPIVNHATVTVQGGTGGGQYKEGDMCTLVADIPEGHSFRGWTVFGVQVSTNNPYVFKVDFDIEVKAEFAPLPKEKFEINVSAGIIGDTGLSSALLEDGTHVKIHAAESQSRVFEKWVVDGKESKQNPYSLLVTKNVDIVACFNEFCMVSVSGGTIDDERSKLVEQGGEVTVKPNAAPEGQRFAYWYILDDNRNEVVKSQDATYSFVVGDSLKIYAKYTYCFNVNVVNGTIKDAEGTTIEKDDGQPVTVMANAAPDGKAFIGWFEGEQKVSLNKDFTFSVQNNVTVEAKYGELKITKLAKPSSANNVNYPTSGLIYRESGGAVAFDRLNIDTAQGETMFVSGVEHVLFKLYTSATADKADFVGSLKLTLSPAGTADNTNAGKLETMDGAISITIRGSAGNYYFDYNHYPTFQSMIKHAVGYAYNAGQKYYFAAQAVANAQPILTFEDNFALQYENSDVSDIGTNDFCENANAPVGQHEIKVIGGIIGDNLSSVTAGYGAAVTFTTTMPTDESIEWVFVGWQEVTMQGTTEVLGAILSKNLTFTLKVTKPITLKAMFKDKAEIEYEQLGTPDNSANKLIFEEGDSSRPIALDRAPSGSMFGENIECVILYIYASSSAEKTDFKGAIKFYVDLNKDADGGRAIVGYFTLMDGTQKTEIVRGDNNNYYLMDRGGFASLIVKALGNNYDSTQSYYFAAKSVAKADTNYIDSEISAIGTNGIKF